MSGSAASVYIDIVGRRVKRPLDGGIGMVIGYYLNPPYRQLPQLVVLRSDGEIFSDGLDQFYVIEGT